jgi:hypothetical protein
MLSHPPQKTHPNPTQPNPTQPRPWIAMDSKISKTQTVGGSKYQLMIIRWVRRSSGRACEGRTLAKGAR